MTTIATTDGTTIRVPASELAAVRGRVRAFVIRRPASEVRGVRIR